MRKTTLRTGSAVMLIWASLAVPAPAAAVQEATPDQQQKGKEVVLIGCVELERDYRARTKAGPGGLLGTGVGVGNEFVLTNARPARSPAGEAPADYSLTGRRERDLLRQVGRQIEVVGVLEDEKSNGLQVVNVMLWRPVADYCPSAK